MNRPCPPISHAGAVANSSTGVSASIPRSLGPEADDPGYRTRPRSTYGLSTATGFRRRWRSRSSTRPASGCPVPARNDGFEAPSAVASSAVAGLAPVPVMVGS